MNDTHEATLTVCYENSVDAGVIRDLLLDTSDEIIHLLRDTSMTGISIDVPEVEESSHDEFRIGQKEDWTALKDVVTEVVTSFIDVFTDLLKGRPESTESIENIGSTTNYSKGVHSRSWIREKAAIQPRAMGNIRYWYCPRTPEGNFVDKNKVMRLLDHHAVLGVTHDPLFFESILIDNVKGTQRLYPGDWLMFDFGSHYRYPVVIKDVDIWELLET